ncbi:helix-turn-helix transcriptional regulator [Frankia sp. AgPm24]|uniref:winged helix-turn-helix transcriptional regulator n=1 Tax=Frankia sp. AgPm24 TaxID=631128 RepID=UPI002010BE5E|nr:helix-turn-helix domain-containing protein [Frankia sp. AgPm24]MCK9923861.1 helix-turn-helix transcriptional regulator [Frankia sp. AgPm24]
MAVDVGKIGYRGLVQRVADAPTFDPACPTSAVPFRIGEKWTAMIVLCLEGGPRRFTELRQILTTVSAKVLTESLRAMERDGLISRQSHDENPPRVEYRLTDLGRSLLQLIDAARRWSRDNLDDLLAARERYDDDARLGAAGRL